MISKKTIREILIGMGLMFLLTGCSIRPALSQKELLKTADNQSTLLVEAKKIQNKSTTHVDLAKKATYKIKIKPNKNNKKSLLRVAKKVKSNLEVVENSAIVSNLPKEVIDYSHKVLDYITLIESGKATLYKANQAFHKAEISGANLAFTYNNAKTSNALGKVIENDVVLQEKLSSANKKAKQQKKKAEKETTNKASLTSNQKNLSKKEQLAKAKEQLISKNGILKSKHKLGKTKMPIEEVKVSNNNKNKIPLCWGCLFICLSILIIIAIFLQPSKQDDSMNALTESGGASLFTRPKPRGYQLFLLRTTESLTLLLIIALVLLNFIRK